MNFKLSNSSIFTFSKHNPPALCVPSGSVVEIDTLDCFSNQIQTKEDKLESIDWERVNPATGPIFIEGANPGDVLKVTIEGMWMSEQGVMAVGKDLGVLGHLFEGIESRIVPVVDHNVVFDYKIFIPANPMIGVIGVAPEGDGISCGTPGSHGGNMDNLMITTGATLYLPIYVEGALFALGDLHAAMGDGEIGVSGVEVAGNVKVRLEVSKGLKLNNPVLENVDYFTTIASADTLDEAVKQATIDMAEILHKKINLPMSKLAMLMSAVGHTQICQVVDPLRTARFVMPKWVLEKYGFTF